MTENYDDVALVAELARLSNLCHGKVAAGISVTVPEEQIDQLAADLGA